MTLLTVLRGKPSASAMYRTLRPSSDRATAFALQVPFLMKTSFHLQKLTPEILTVTITQTRSVPQPPFFFFFN
jgi:hypothetical protein